MDLDQPLPRGVSRNRDHRVQFEVYHTQLSARLRRLRLPFGLLISLVFVGYPISAISGFYGIRGAQTSYYAALAMGIGCLGTMLLYLIRPRLRCVCCEKNLERRWTHYCSECGSGNVDHPRFFSLRIYPRCQACGAKPIRGGRSNRRYYKIRFCTHCGVYLHTEGI